MVTGLDRSYGRPMSSRRPGRGTGLLSWQPAATLVCVALLLVVLVVPPVTIWVLSLVLAAYFLGGGEWGIFGAEAVDPSWWASVAMVVALVSGVVLVVSTCLGLPVLLGLRQHDQRRGIRARPALARRTTRVVLLLLGVSLALRALLTQALWLLDWAQEDFTSKWLVDRAGQVSGSWSRGS
jgi:hypothetical protein